MNKSIAVDIPEASGYGAAELKLFIEKYTYRAFFYTMGLILLMILLSFVYDLVLSAAKSAPKLAPLVKMELVDIPPPLEEAPPPPPPQTIVNTGPAARAGTPIPIPDAEIKPDLQDFASMDIMDRASAVGGDGLDLGGFSNNIDFDRKNLNVNVSEEEPDPDDFIAVEPQIDMAQLQRLVVYPDIAKKANIEGRVILRVLVGKDGKVKKSTVEYSDNSLLDNAALDAIKKYGHIPPAIQNKQPVQYWLNIPILFKLR